MKKKFEIFRMFSEKKIFENFFSFFIELSEKSAKKFSAKIVFSSRRKILRKNFKNSQKSVI
jgi:16S rRNA A1518/A1519 N6-dimethyltransferase RsmA/KsgA/DIM1 with predicted DNA glycosylase/AP lyase activity